MRQRRRNSTHHLPPLKVRGGAYIKFYTESRNGITSPINPVVQFALRAVVLALSANYLSTHCDVPVPTLSPLYGHVVATDRARLRVYQWYIRPQSRRTPRGNAMASGH